VSDQGQRGDDEGWVAHPMHPTRARLSGEWLVLEQRVSRRLRVGPLLSAAVMVLLERYTSWDGDEDNDTFWGVAFAVMGDWPAQEKGLLQLVRGGDGRPGLRRKRKPARIQQDLAAAWRGTARAAPWLDVGSTGVVPLVLHYQPVAERYPEIWAEVRAMVTEALTRLEGRSAYQLARVVGALPPLGPRCAWCGSPEALTFDHAQPLEQGGHPWGDNLLTACRPCNLRKGATPLRRWLEGAQSADPEAIQRAVAVLDGERPALAVPPRPPARAPGEG
jgi:hypothetical protein